MNEETLIRTRNKRSGIFTDVRDGRKYRTIKIGGQTWMGQNLSFAVENSISYGEWFGRYYDFENAAEACPKGWHIPTYKEWKRLIDFCGGTEVAGKVLKTKGIWKPNWRYRIERGNNATGFFALPSGICDSRKISKSLDVFKNPFREVSEKCYFMMANKSYDDSAMVIIMQSSNSKILLGYPSGNGYKIPIRCIKD